MVGADTILKDLLTLRDEHAKASLEKPKDKTEFGYGETVGTYKGLSLAISKIEQMLEQEARDALDREDKDL